MPGYTVEVLTINGKWVPKDGIFKLQSLASAALDTFAARLDKQRSKIREWPSGKLVVEAPPRAVHILPTDIHRMIPVVRKLAV